jgi:hypothetical protein
VAKHGKSGVNRYIGVRQKKGDGEISRGCGKIRRGYGKMKLEGCVANFSNPY